MTSVLLLFGCSRKQITHDVMEATDVITNKSKIKKISDITMYRLAYNMDFFVLKRNPDYTILLSKDVLNDSMRINDKTINVEDFTKTTLYWYLNGKNTTSSGYNDFIDCYFSASMVGSFIYESEKVDLLTRQYIDDNFNDSLKNIILEGYGDFWLGNKEDAFFEYCTNNGMILSKSPTEYCGLRPVIYIKTELLNDYDTRYNNY